MTEFLDGKVGFPTGLIEALSNKCLIPFVGAGVSMSVKKQGSNDALFPSWTALLKTSAEEIENYSDLKSSAADLIRAHLNHGDDDSYLEAAKLAQKTLGNQRWNQLIKRHLDFNQSDCDQASLGVAKAIWQLDTPLTITTNYDKVLDWACPVNRIADLNHWDIEAKFEQANFLANRLDKPTIWHLHGRISNVDKLILTPDGYHQLYGNESLSSDYQAALRTLENLFTSHTLLFIGFSFSDNVFSNTLRSISECFKGNAHQHYILIKESQRKIIDDLDLPLIPITYPDHKDLLNLLLELSKSAQSHSEPTPTQTLAATSSTTSTAHYSPENAVFNLPYRQKGDGVVGREQVLLDLRAQLTNGRRSSIGHAASFRGMGGLGKTQLAVEYAYRYKEEYPKGVIWVFADQDIDSQLIDLAEKALWFSPNLEPTDKLYIAKQQLKKRSDCLIVFDNVEALEQIKDYLPDVSATPHVLITSRLDIKGFTALPLNLLSQDESVELLLKEAHRDLAQLETAEQAACNTITETLGFLPLAIELAGAYLRKFPSISFTRYQSLLDKSLLDNNLTKALPDQYLDSLTAHQKGLFSTLALTDEEIKQTPLLEDILLLLSWSASAAMGISLMASLLNVEEEELFEPLALGVELRLFSMEKEGQEERYAIHRLLKEIQSQLNPIQERSDWAQHICQRMITWFEARREEFLLLKGYQAEIDHLEHWQTVAEQQQWPDSAALLWLQAYPLWHLGQYQKSAEILEQALKLVDLYGIPDSAETQQIQAHLFADLGLTLNYLGLYNEALLYDQKALSLRQDLFGEMHSDTATSYNNIGGTYGNKGKHEKALEYQTKALELNIQLLGETHPNIASSYNNIGVTYGELGQHEKGLEYQTKALELRIKFFGENHPDIANSYNNIGTTCRKMGQYEKALEYHTKALDLTIKLFGEAHPDTANSYNSIGITYSDLRQDEKALGYEAKALELRKKLLGGQHPNTGSSYHNIALTYLKLEMYDEALTHSKKAFQICLANFTLNADDLLNSMWGVISTLVATKQFHQALKELAPLEKLAPKNKAIKRELDRMKRRIKSEGGKAGARFHSATKKASSKRKK